jgi:hypothetical protein
VKEKLKNALHNLLIKVDDLLEGLEYNDDYTSANVAAYLIVELDSAANATHIFLNDLPTTNEKD